MLDLLKSSRLIIIHLGTGLLKTPLKEEIIVLLFCCILTSQPAEERSVDQAAMISPSRLLAPQRDLCSDQSAGFAGLNSY